MYLYKNAIEEFNRVFGTALVLFNANGTPMLYDGNQKIKIDEVNASSSEDRKAAAQKAVHRAVVKGRIKTREDIELVMSKQFVSKERRPLFFKQSSKTSKIKNGNK